jgi:oligopeptide transport system substrate-binding protein
MFSRILVEGHVKSLLTASQRFGVTLYDVGDVKTNLVFFGLLSLLVLGGCGSGKPEANTSEQGGKTFRYAINVPPVTLDPGLVEDVDTSDIILNVYEGLVGYDENNKIVGRLAESWKASDGGKTWTFKLRPNIKFHNGRLVTADDFKWTLERNCNHNFPSPTANNYLRDIVGVNEVIQGKTNQISGVKVVDPTTIQFTLDKPRAYFLGKLTYPCAFVLPKEAAGTTPINGVKAAIGTGPFKLAAYRVDQEVELAANKDYYLGAPKVDRVLRPVIKDSSTRLNLFKTGKLDILTLDRKDVEGIAADPLLGKQLQYQMRPAVYYLGLNLVAYPPFKNRDVRRAIAMAIDRDHICNVLMKGMPEAHGLVSPGMLSYRDKYAGLPYDPSAAQKALTAAGYPGGQGLPPLQLTYRVQTPDAQHVSEGVAASLRQNLGINVQLSSIDWNSFLEGRNKSRFAFYFLSWYADYLDPENFLSFLFRTGTSQNHDGYSNPEADRLFDLGDTTIDESQRVKYYNQAEDLLVQDGARIPIYIQRDAILVSPKVTGLKSNLFGQLPNLTVDVSQTGS